jgi:hypothetical protein
MKTKQNQCKSSAGIILTGCLALVLSGFLPGTVLAKDAREIDASVDVAIDRFYKQTEKLLTTTIRQPDHSVFRLVHRKKTSSSCS